jgi:glycosyltransferase involved in cell wall biosynthesis
MSITVLIPVHGTCPYIDVALESIFADAEGLIVEILIVLDRPSDVTRKLLERYRSEHPIRILESTEPGIVAALNFGLESASHEYIARLDADDVMVRGRLSAQQDYLDCNREVAVIGSQIELINEIGETIGLGNYPLLKEEVHERLPFACCMAHPAVMFRRSIVKQVGGYRKFYEFAEDYDLWLRIMEISFLANLKEPYTKYRIHSGQTSERKKLIQITTSRAVNESYFRRIKGKSDLQEIYKSPEEWALKSKSTRLIDKEISARDFLKGLNAIKFSRNRPAYFRSILFFSCKHPSQTIYLLIKFLRKL